MDADSLVFPSVVYLQPRFRGTRNLLGLLDSHSPTKPGVLESTVGGRLEVAACS